MFKAILGRLRQRLESGRLRIALALCLVVGASVLFWASRDYTVVAPDWDGQVRGVTYNPSHLFNLRDKENVSPEQIDRDMAQLSLLTGGCGPIRCPTVGQGAGNRAPARVDGLARLLDFARPGAERARASLCIRTALANRRVIDRVFVGNEAILFGYVTPDQLNGYIRRVRDALPTRIKITPPSRGRPGC